MTVAGDVEGDVDALPAGDSGIDFVLQPVLGDFPLDVLNIPGEPCTEVAGAAGDTEASFGAAGGEAAIGAADRAAFAEGDLVGIFLGRGFRLLFGGSGSLF